MTLAKLAVLANVSVSSVSKAFSGSKEISAETKEMIFQIAKENKCFDKYYKNTYPKPVIGVICPEYYSRFYGDYLTILEKDTAGRNAIMLTCATDFLVKKEKDLLEYFTTFAKVDGIIVLTPKSQKINNCSVPVVSIDLCENIDSIHYDYDNAILDAIKLFQDNGHTEIGFIGEKLTKSKEESFVRAMKKLNIEINPDFFIVSEKRFEYAGYSSMETLFERKSLPTAILAAYDYMALGIMHSVQSRGLKIPDDISLIGMDDIEESAYLNVPLTTIKTFKQEAVTIALDILFKKISNPLFTVNQKIEVPSRLIVRSSVSRKRTV